MIKVLLIEQETLFQKAFAKMVENTEGFTLVGIAESGIQAMNMMNRYHPQVVFSEVVLGNENGIDVCKNIKKLYPNLLIYILSNYRNMKLINKAMQAGFEKYLIKPISRTEITSLQIKEYHEDHQEEENETVKELFLAVEEKDYKKSYEVTRRLIGQMFESMEATERKSMLKAIASSLLNQIPCLDQSQHEHYMQKNKLSTKILSKNVLSCCWLMQIITEVFRQMCVIKYSHMNRVLQYIENNINNEISLTDLSEQAGVSSGYLSRIFKKYYHISVVDYIHMRKILVAKQYMVSSEMNISDISFLLGYSEAGYFCKIFKKYENMTPSAFNNAYVS